MSVETGDFEAPMTPSTSRVSIESIETIVSLARYPCPSLDRCSRQSNTALIECILVG